MSTPVIFPEWLPPSVAHAAEELLEANLEDRGKEIIFRLATDKRMEAIWRELEKCDLAEARDDDPLWEAPSHEAALIYFFVDAWQCASPSVRATKRSELTALRDAYLSHAAKLRESAKWLRAQGLPLGSPLVGLMWRARMLGSYRASKGVRRRPRLGSEHVGVRLRASSSAPQVERAANMCTSVADAISASIADHPLVIDRDHGSSKERGYVQALAANTRGWLIEVPPNVLATVANVALAPSTPVTTQQARNWCRSVNKDT
jgi:hypothetical protein